LLLTSGNFAGWSLSTSKLERFKAAEKGQIELYLRWPEKHEMERGEDTPIGLILCADKGDELPFTTVYKITRPPNEG
jgi:hypothetical protein